MQNRSKNRNSVIFRKLKTADHCSRSLQQITAADHCSRSLQQITAADHCSRSLQQITAADHCSRSLQQITAADHCSRSLQSNFNDIYFKNFKVLLMQHSYTLNTLTIVFYLIA